MTRTIAHRIKQLRTKNNWSQRVLAEKTGVSQAVIALYENETSPTSTNLIKLSEVFDCSVDYLLGLTEEKGRMSEKEIYAIKELQKKLDKELDLVELMKKPTPIKINGKELSEKQMKFLNDMLEALYRLG